MAELEGATFQNNLQRIWSLVENDQVRSIGVHGMCGVGKTTLAEHIYNRLLNIGIRVYWVVVSRGCSIEMLQGKIAHELGLDFSGEAAGDVGAKAKRLSYTLSWTKNSVLILDNVQECIDLVKVGLPLSLKWMMTSPSLNACQEMNCQEMILVEPLRKDEGWNLFLKNLATSALRYPEVEGIAKRMVENFDGLPLGIIALAGAVSEVTEIQEWRHELRVLEESAMGQEWMEEKVLRVLKYSFDRLNPNDQKCFLHCYTYLYPKDKRELIKELVSNLMMARLVDEKKSRKAHRDEVYSIVSRLVKVSLLDNNREGVKMHDLVRGMAHKISKGKIMVIYGDKSRKEIPIEEEWTKDLETASLMYNDIKEIPHGISPNCPRLTVLLLQGNPLRKIATSFFTLMCGLRTLDLSFTNIEELPDSVSDLVNLTSLLLQNCGLEGVPCVRKLKKLREFDISYTLIETNPEGMEELRLQILRLPFFTEAELVEGGEWESLEVFEGRLNMPDFNRVFGNKQEDHVSYSIVVGDNGNMIEPEFGFKYDTRELFVCDYSALECESTTILAADNVQRLGFVYYYFTSKCLLDKLSNPVSLEFLHVSSCVGIECLLTYDQYKVAPQGSKSRFQALQVIELFELEDFMGVIHKLEIETDHNPPPPSVFSSLRELTIGGCNKMKNPGLPFSIIEKLEAISIEQCEEMEEIIQVADPPPSSLISSLRRITISGCNKMKNLGLPLSIIEKLEDITIKDCKEIEEIVQAAAAAAVDPSLFSSLRRLTISGCNKLKRLGLPNYICGKLEEINIEDCDEIEEMIQSSLFSSLTSLTISRCNKMKSLVQLLESISIEECEDMEE